MGLTVPWVGKRPLSRDFKKYKASLKMPISTVSDNIHCYPVRLLSSMVGGPSDLIQSPSLRVPKLTLCVSPEFF